MGLAAASVAFVVLAAVAIIVRAGGDAPVQTGPVATSPAATGHPRFLPSALPPWVRMSTFFDMERRGGRTAVWSKPMSAAPNGVAQVRLSVAGADELAPAGFAVELPPEVTTAPANNWIDVPAGPAGPSRTIPSRALVHDHSAIATYGGGWRHTAGACCFSLSWQTGTDPSSVVLEGEGIGFDELLGFANSLPPVLDGWLDGPGPASTVPAGYQLTYVGPTPSASGGPYVRWSDDLTGRTSYTLRTMDWASFDDTAAVLLRGREPDIIGRDDLRFGSTRPEVDPRSAAEPGILLGGRSDVVLELSCSGCTGEQLEAVARSMRQVSSDEWIRYGDTGTGLVLDAIGGPTPEELVSTGEVSGRIIRVDGPSPGSTTGLTGHVIATPVGGGSPLDADTDATGRYVLRLPPGRYVLSATSPQISGGGAPCTYDAEVPVVANTAGQADLACVAR